MHHAVIVCALDDEGASLRILGSLAGRAGVQEGELKCPSGVATGADGLVYVVELGGSRLQTFEVAPSGERGAAGQLPKLGLHVDSVGKHGTPHEGVNRLRAPCDVALHGDRCFVSDTGNCRIVAYSQIRSNICLEELFAFGQRGEGEGDLCGPQGLAASDDAELFVADRYNHRVQVFQCTDGRHLRTLGSRRSNRPGLFAEPFGVACAHGRLYVSEWHGNRVQVLTPQGVPLQALAPPRADNLGGICFVGSARHGALACVLEPMAGVLHLLAVDADAPDGEQPAPADPNAPSTALARSRERAMTSTVLQVGPPTSPFVSPITMRRMHEPAVTADGHTYERRAIEHWLVEHDTSPLTGQRLPNKTLSLDGCAHQRREALQRGEERQEVQAAEQIQ